MKTRYSLFALLLGLLVFQTACRVVPYQRTLPDWIRRVYVPIAVNNTTEVGLEKLASDKLQEHILRDGRLEIVAKGKADAVVRLRLDQNKSVSSHFSSDDVENQREMTMTYTIELFEPTDMRNPFASTKKTTVVYNYSSDIRSLGYVPHAEARKEYANRIAKSAFFSLMNEVRPITEENKESRDKKDEKKNKKDK